MVTVTTARDLIWDTAGRLAVVGQSPYKIKADLDILSKWILTDQLNELRMFEFSVKNDDFEKENVLLERNIIIPLLTPFTGIITEKEPLKDKIKFRVHELAWHLKRRKFKCHDKARLKYTVEDWYDKDWQFRRNLSIKGKRIKLGSGAIRNQALQFKTTDPELREHALSDGRDIIFTTVTSDGEIVLLKSEIESFNGNTGEIIAWIQFPEIRNNTDQEFQMYYKNPNPPLELRESPWDEKYSAVWHMNYRGSNLFTWDTVDFEIEVNEPGLYLGTYGYNTSIDATDGRNTTQIRWQKDGVDILPGSSDSYDRNISVDNNGKSHLGWFLLDKKDRIRLTAKEVGSDFEVQNSIVDQLGFTLTRIDRIFGSNSTQNSGLWADYREKAGGQSLLITASDIIFADTEHEDKIYERQSTSKIRVKQGGHYLVSYSMKPGNFAAGTRAGPICHLETNGVAEKFGWGMSYIRTSIDIETANSCAILNLKKDDDITINHIRKDNDTTTIEVGVDGSSWQFLKLDDNDSYCRLSEVTGSQTIVGDNIGITFDTNDELDTGYTHTTGSADITIASPGHYLVTWNIAYDASLGTGRHSGYLTLGGVRVKESHSTGLARVTSLLDEGYITGSCIIETAATDTVLNLRTDQIDVVGGTRTIRANETGICIMKLRENNDYLRRHSIAAVSLSPTTQSSINLNTEGENQTTPIIDSTNNGNHGILTGAIDVAGLTGRALNFNGIDNKVDVGFDSSIDNIFSASVPIQADDLVSYSRFTPTGPISTVIHPTGEVSASLVDLITTEFPINEIGVNISTSIGKLRIKVYDVGDDGYPNNLIGETNSFPSPGTGLRFFKLQSPVATSSNQVWVAIEHDTSGFATLGSQNTTPNGDERTVGHSFGPGPDPFGTAFATNDPTWFAVRQRNAGPEDIGGVLEFTFKPDGADESTAVIFDKSNGGTNGNNGWSMRVVDDTVNRTSQLQFFKSFTTGEISILLKTNLEWDKSHRIAMSYFDEEIDELPTFYVNGIEQETELLADTTVNPTGSPDSDVGQAATIGNWPLQSRTFKGVIEEVRLVNLIPKSGFTTEEYYKLIHDNLLDPENWFIYGTQEEFSPQADVLMDRILKSANTDMPNIKTTILPEPNLWLKFDSTLLDSSLNTNDIVLKKGEVLFKEGKYGKEGRFRIGTWGEVIDDSIFDVTKFTLSMFLTKEVEPGTNNAEIFSKIKTSGGWSIQFDDSTKRKIQLKLRNTGAVDFITSKSVQNVHAVGDRVHYVWVVDTTLTTGNIKVFENGVLLGSTGTSTGTYGIPTGTNIKVSRSSEFPLLDTLETDVTYDEIRFYDELLTDAQVKALSSATTTGKTEVKQDIQWKLGDGKVTEIPNLISLWKLDQNVLDLKSDNDGNIIGTEKFADGVYGTKAFDFDGSTRIQTANTPFRFKRTDKFSFTFHIKPTDQTFQQVILSKGPSTDVPRYVIFTETDEKLAFLMQNSTTNRTYVRSNNALSTTKYTFVAVTNDGSGGASGIKIYFNGVIAPSTIITDTNTLSILNDDRLTLGADSIGGAGLIGQEDDVRVYSGTLTPVEVKRLFEATDSGIDRVRDDNIPMRRLEIDFNHKDHLEALQKIAIELGTDIYFDSNEFRVFIRPKGKKVKPIFDTIQVAKPKFDLSNVANVVNIIGNTKDGEQKEKTFEAVTSLKYNYEQTYADNQITTDDTLDLIGTTVLDQFKELNPDLIITAPYDQFVKEDLVSGDKLNINELDQDLQGVFRISQIKVKPDKVEISLNRDTKALVQTSGVDIASIITNLIKTITDIQTEPE